MEQVGFFSSIKRGWKIAMTGWTFILNNPTILFFSTVSVVINFLIILWLIQYSLTEIVINHNKNILDAVSPKIFLAIVITFFLLQGLFYNFMQTAQSAYAVQIFENKEQSIFKALIRALSRFFTLLFWTIINFFLGMIISRLESQRKGIIGFLLRQLGHLLSLAWSILTFFVIPILAIKDLNIIDTIKESGNTMKQTWGENLGATFNIGLVHGLIYLLLTSAIGLLVSAFGYNLIAILIHGNPLPEDQVYNFMFWVAIILVAPSLLLSPLFTTAHTLFRTAIYQYTLNRPTGPFSESFIKQSFAQLNK
jgi:hypothetical protein